MDGETIEQGIPSAAPDSSHLGVLGDDLRPEVAVAEPEEKAPDKPRMGRPPGSKNKPKPEGASSPKKGSVSSGPSLRKLEGDLVRTFTEIGLGVSMGAPLIGYVIGSNGPRRAKAWIALAESNPQIRKGMERFVDVGGMSFILTDAAAIGFAAAVEFLGYSPLSIPAQSLGIDKAYEEVFGPIPVEEIPEREDGENASRGGVLGDVSGQA
jgi:hypothetical protein